MSAALDRLRLRQAMRVYDRGLDALAGDVGTGGAPSLPLETPDYGPTPVQLAETAKFRERQAAAASASSASGKKTELPVVQSKFPAAQSFLEREAFAGVPWWGVIFGMLSVTTIGVGSYFLVKG